jgi:hypothetical protein
MHQTTRSRVIAIYLVESNSCLSFPEVMDCVQSLEAELLGRALAFGWPPDATGPIYPQAARDLEVMAHRARV